MEGFEVERDFPRIGRRTMLLNARKVFYEGNGQTTILRRSSRIRPSADKSERALQKLLEQKEMLLTELSHRVANSLQIIASILLMKARSVELAETRLHLQDAHRRVMSVASVQKHLQASGNGELIPVGPYLSKLCETLASSMIGDNRPISIKVVADDGATTSDQAVSIGLIVTELVINALKHAFAESTIDGHVVVGYEVHGANWKLSISDTGAGMPDLRPGDELDQRAGAAARRAGRHCQWPEWDDRVRAPTLSLYLAACQPLPDGKELRRARCRVPADR